MSKSNTSGVVLARELNNKRKAVFIHTCMDEMQRACEEMGITERLGFRENFGVLKTKLQTVSMFIR